ncbi:MAG: PAS domain S-box protein [Desulfobulbaceae bacterium]|nr:PAS domain S-box protein [Desulfobulbaceae bacterium]
MDDNGNKFLIGIIRDFTEARKIRDAIKESELKYKTLFDSVPIGLTVADKNGTIIESNKMAEALLGLSAEEQKKRKIDGIEWQIIRSDGSPFPQEEYASVKALKENRLVENVEMGIVKNKEEITWINVSAVPFNFTNLGVLVAYNDITKRKKAENEALKNNQKYQSLVELSNDIIWAVDANGIILEMSPGSLDIYGYKPEELIGKNFLDFVPDEQKLKDRPVVSEGESVKEYDSTFLHKDGHIVYLKANSIVEKDKDGKLTKIIGTSKDVTKEVEAKMELRESNRRFEKAQEMGKVASFEYDIKTEKYIVSDEGKRIYGYSTEIEAFSADDVWKCIPETERVQQDWIDLIEKDKPYDIEHEIRPISGPSSKTIRAIAEVIKDADGNPIKVVGFIQDITKQKNAELELQSAYQQLQANEQQLRASNQQLAASEQQLRATNQQLQAGEQKLKLSDRVFNLTLDMFCIAGFDGYFKYLNPSWERILGWTIEELLSKPWLEFVYPEDVDKTENVKSVIVDGKEIYQFENRYLCKDGTIRWLSWNSQPFPNENIMIGAVRDITESKKIEQELITAKEKAEESDRLKSAFLANMSHEIRTPMNGILGFTQLLLEPDLSSEEKDEFINLVQKSGQRMLNTVNDIVEISKIEAGLVNLIEKETDINDRVEDLTNFFRLEAEKKGLNLIFDKLFKSEIIILTDQNKLDSILTNLIKNAIKYTDTGTINVGCRQKGTEVEFYVKDTGIGIPAHRQKAVFNRFEQADIADTKVFEGSGLGLAIVKSYVEMLGGVIWVESEVGSGSTFYFTLPIKNNLEKKPNDDKDISSRNEMARPKVKGLNILIAEDDEISRHYISLIVKDISSEIVEANTGFEAIELCRQNKDVDLVLMDIKMPGMDGYEASRIIREFNKDVVIIAQTAYGLSGDREKAIQAGCNDYISKPIKKDLLLRIINRCFNK